MDVLFFQKLPKDIRGAMCGARALFAVAFNVFFVYYAGYLFDNEGKYMPFTLLGGLDLVFALAVILIICFGKQSDI
jgi:hypothetical protein